MREDFDLDHHLATLRDHLPEITKQFQIRSLGIFGSYVRHEQGPESDLDILVSFAKPPGLLTFLALENHLTDLLGIKVDLVMRDALKPTIGQRILSEVVPI